MCFEATQYKEHDIILHFFHSSVSASIHMGNLIVQGNIIFAILLQTGIISFSLLIYPLNATIQPIFETF